jgi:hypothetical protein
MQALSVLNLGATEMEHENDSGHSGFRYTERPNRDLQHSWRYWEVGLPPIFR